MKQKKKDTSGFSDPRSWPSAELVLSNGFRNPLCYTHQGFLCFPQRSRIQSNRSDPEAKGPALGLANQTSSCRRKAPIVRKEIKGGMEVGRKGGRGRKERTGKGREGEKEGKKKRGNKLGMWMTAFTHNFKTGGRKHSVSKKITETQMFSLSFITCQALRVWQSFTTWCRKCPLCPVQEPNSVTKSPHP